MSDRRDLKGTVEEGMDRSIGDRDARDETVYAVREEVERASCRAAEMGR